MRAEFVGGSMDGRSFDDVDALINDRESLLDIPWEDYEAASGNDDVTIWRLREAERAPEPFVGPSLDGTAAEPSQSSQPVDGEEDLMAWRKRMKASRGDVQAVTGLTQGIIARIETKGGKPEEVSALVAGLRTIEARG